MYISESGKEDKKLKKYRKSGIQRADDALTRRRIYVELQQSFR